MNLKILNGQHKMHTGLFVGGIILGIIGFFLTITIIFSIIGIPLLIAGIIMFVLGLCLTEQKHGKK